MNDKDRVAMLGLIFVGVVLAALLFIFGNDIAVLSPKGTIASQQRHLIIIATLLMLIVVVPVFILTFGIVWRYRESNTKAKYAPDWDHHPTLEFMWWAIPTAIIVVLATIAWKSSHNLDPFKPVSSSVKPIPIQVVALQWKWLFIYPQQNIASVNFVQFPQATPINFEITSDAPMNSFWIPQLGGQIYAMSGMTTQLHLMANETGNYRGSSANISGAGFASMKFIAHSSSRADFDQWIAVVKKSPNQLHLSNYNQLAAPSQAASPTYYSFAQADLFDRILIKYMPDHQNHAQSLGAL